MAFQLAGTKRIGSRVSEYEPPGQPWERRRRIHFDLTDGEAVVISYYVAGGFVEYPQESGFFIPSLFRYLTVRHDLPYAVTMEIATSALTAPRVLSLTVSQKQSIDVGELGGKPARSYPAEESIRPGALRLIPEGRLLAQALLAATHTECGLEGVPDFEIREADIERAYKAGRSRAQHGRGATVDDARLQRVAELYRTATSDRTQAIMRAFQVSQPTAGRYILQARQRGFLRAAPGKGKAGEVDE